MRRNVLLLLLVATTVFFGGQQANASAPRPEGGDGTSSTTNRISDKDLYVDLNTGKEFRFIYDNLNDIYNREDLFSLDLFVNTRTKDTFWLEDALVVNDALLRDAAGTYKVDPMKVKRYGNTYKVKDGVGILNAKKPIVVPAPANPIAPTQTAPATTTDPVDDSIRVGKQGEEGKTDGA